MGKRITQKIYTCHLCNKTPEDGGTLWEMGNEVWCDECADKIENCKHPRERRTYIGRNKLRCDDCGYEFE